jgi:hypothetical protein
MPRAEPSQESGPELRWRKWLERGKKADKLAEKRMTVLFSVVGLILLALILYYTLWARESPATEHAGQLADPGRCIQHVRHSAKEKLDFSIEQECE